MMLLILKPTKVYLYYEFASYSPFYCFTHFFYAGLDPKTPMKAVFEQFGLDQNTQDFTGHAVALYRDDK